MAGFAVIAEAGGQTMEEPFRSRDRVLGGILALVAVAAQFYWMGSATAVLCIALIIGYVLWAMNRWNNEPKTVLPVYLSALAVQCLHFAEEFVTGFQHQFPKLFGYEWSDARFVVFNLIWLAVFTLAALGVYQRVRLAYLAVFFFALGGGVGNGLGHLLLSARVQRYFPGLATAPFCLCLGVTLLLKLFRSKKEIVLRKE